MFPMNLLIFPRSFHFAEFSNRTLIKSVIFCSLNNASFVVFAVGSGNVRTVRCDDNHSLKTPRSRSFRDRTAVASGRKKRTSKTKSEDETPHTGPVDSRSAALAEALASLKTIAQVYYLSQRYCPTKGASRAAI